MQQAKYGDKPCSAADLLMAAAKNAAKQGKKFLTDLKDDSEESGAEGVPAATAAADQHDDDDEPQAGTIVVSVVEAHDCHLALRHSMRPASKGSLAAEKNCREGKISSPSRDVSGGAPPGRENGGSYV